MSPPKKVKVATVVEIDSSNSTVLNCSIRRPYITFKLPRGYMDTPPRLRNFFRYLAPGMCHFLPVRHHE